MDAIHKQQRLDIAAIKAQLHLLAQTLPEFHAPQPHPDDHATKLPDQLAVTPVSTDNTPVEGPTTQNSSPMIVPITASQPAAAQPGELHMDVHRPQVSDATRDGM